jgi:hypothetical protein
MSILRTLDANPTVAAGAPRFRVPEASVFASFMSGELQAAMDSPLRPRENWLLSPRKWSYGLYGGVYCCHGGEF